MKHFVIVIALTALAACSTGPGGGYKQPTGTLVGAVGGAAAGSQFGSGTGRVVTTALGTLLGAAVGSDVGASLDRADAVYARGYVPGYYAPSPPAYYSPTPYAPAAAPIYSTGPGYAVPGSVRWASAPSVTAGCQRVGNGIWCEQPNGTFSGR